MCLKKFLLALVLLVGFSAYADNPCTSKEACVSDPNCQCWCSVKCGWRDKKEGDHPIYVKNDPNGKHCYCKQWDFDHYEDNCVQGKHIPQPQGAK